mmetsp:Transcript_28237/g.47488  ORF Transcript_28237/g.47488 Transcript_28237/m.47488 type:complete len:140 (+) Transcript_28237:34-453(+)
MMSTIPDPSVSDLRKVQLKYEEKISMIIQNLDRKSADTLRSFEYRKECSELAKHSGRMLSRWRKTASLGTELFTELGIDISREEREIHQLETQLSETVTALEEARNENDEIQNLMDILNESIQRGQQEGTVVSLVGEDT